VTITVSPANRPGTACSVGDSCRRVISFLRVAAFASASGSPLRDRAVVVPPDGVVPINVSALFADVLFVDLDPGPSPSGISTKPSRYSNTVGSAR